jgi:hypothetical protein
VEVIEYLNHISDNTHGRFVIYAHKAGASEFFPSAMKARDISWRQSSRTVSTRQTISINSAAVMQLRARTTSVLFLSLGDPYVVEIVDLFYDFVVLVHHSI